MQPVKAIVQRGYGSADVLSLQDVDKPVVTDGEVLVRVRAASVNVLDWRKMRAAPFLVRMEGFRRPKQPVLGVDTAGVVEEVGRDVTHLAKGDEVFGIGKGSFAEYTALPKMFRPPSRQTGDAKFCLALPEGSGSPTLHSPSALSEEGATRGGLRGTDQAGERRDLEVLVGRDERRP